MYKNIGKLAEFMCSYIYIYRYIGIYTYLYLRATDTHSPIRKKQIAPVLNNKMYTNADQNIITKFREFTTVDIYVLRTKN